MRSKERKALTRRQPVFVRHRDGTTITGEMAEDVSTASIRDDDYIAVNLDAGMNYRP